jgi:hypothetical protein
MARTKILIHFRPGNPIAHISLPHFDLCFSDLFGHFSINPANGRPGHPHGHGAVFPFSLLYLVGGASTDWQPTSLNGRNAV